MNIYQLNTDRQTESSTAVTTGRSALN